MANTNFLFYFILFFIYRTKPAKQVKQLNQLYAPTTIKHYQIPQNCAIVHFLPEAFLYELENYSLICTLASKVMSKLTLTPTVF